MTFRTDDHQTTCCPCFLIKLDIRTTTCHVRCDRNCAMLSCICYDFSLEFMELRIQYLVLDTTSGQHFAQFLTCLDRNRTDKYRLACRMCILNRIHNCIQLFLFRLIYTVLIINSGYRTVCRYDNNVHAIDIPELFFLSQCRTGHTAFFVKFVKEILERNGCKCLALSLDLYMLLCLDRLMKAIGIAASRHDTSCKFVNDQYLIIFYDIVLISEHQVMCS